MLPAPAAAPLTPGALGSGHYPGTAAATPGQPAVGGDMAGALPVDPVTVPPAQLPTYLQRLNPTQRALAVARLRMQVMTAPAAPAAAPAIAPATGGASG